jgi:hypothetical protein
MGHQVDWWGLSFGKQTSATQYGKWNIQVFGKDYPQSLNFWKPIGSANAGNFKFAISEYGHVAIGGEPNPWFQKTTGPFWNQSQVQNFKLQVWGNVVAIGGNFFTHSDSAVKENMQPIQNNTLSQLLKLTPLSYNYKKNIDLGCKNDTPNAQTFEDKVSNPPVDIDSTTHFGFTAQAISRIYPNLVAGIGTSQAINYIEFIPLLLKGIQEQQTIIEGMKQKITDLEGKTVYTDVDKTKLFQNNPNPFRGNTTFTYYIDEATNVSNAVIEIRNIMGILQNTITLGDKSGLGKIEFNADGLADGYFIYSLKVNGNLKDSKMLLIGE